MNDDGPPDKGTFFVCYIWRTFLYRKFFAKRTGRAIIGLILNEGQITNFCLTISYLIFFKPEFTGLSQINKKRNYKYCLTEMRGR